MKIFNSIAWQMLELDVGHNTTDWQEEDENFPVNFELVHAQMIDTSRWSHIWERVYKDLNTGKFYRTTYRTGATECQDERPYEYDGQEVDFDEVEPYEVVQVKYRSVK